jgi:hypothetical protein
VALRFARSAARHGIARDRIRHVIEHCRTPIYSSRPGDDDLVAFFGPDQDGVPLEVAAFELPNGDLLVIHAMRLRRKHLADYQRVVRWDER